MGLTMAVMAGISLAQQFPVLILATQETLLQMDNSRQVNVRNSEHYGGRGKRKSRNSL